MNKKIKFLDLGMQPLANSYIKKNEINLKEKKYRLVVCFDNKTKSVYINKSFSSKVMFDNKYPYRSSMSKTMKNSFKIFANKIKKYFKPKKILEIGSNDGVFLKNFDKKKTIGIEPCSNVAKITKKIGIKTYDKYWNDKLANEILKRHGSIDFIYSANTISHIKNLNNVFFSINKVLSNKGVLVIEEPSLLECLKKNTYDQFYNEHLYVFSYLGLSNLLKKHKLQIYKIEKTDTHGGSNRYFIKKNNYNLKSHRSVFKSKEIEMAYGMNNIRVYNKFANRVKKSKQKLVDIFKNIKKNNKSIIGYGATAKSTTILNYCNIDFKYIDYFFDTTKDKQLKYTPGTKIFIKKYKKNIDKKIDYIFLGAWNFKKEILNKEKKFLNRGGKFIIHTPFPRIVKK